MTRTQPAQFLSLIALTLGLGACGAAAPMHDAAMVAPGPPPPADMAAEAGADMPMSAEVAPAAAAAATGPAAAPAPAQQGQAPTQAKTSAAKDESPVSGDKPEDPAHKPLLIYEAQVGIEVEHGKVAESIDEITDVAEELGGYLVSQNQTSVSVRVPSKHFRKALRDLGSKGDVVRRQVTAQDVSEEYHDLEVQLTNLLAVQKRLQQLLAKAQNVDEALRVGQRLDQIGSQIDRIKGRLQFLRTRAAYSLITVNLQERPKQQKVVAQRPPKKAAPPPPRELDIPVPWLGSTGIDQLLDLKRK